MNHIRESQLLPQLVGVAAGEPFVGNTAAARMLMVNGHRSQALVPAMPDTRYLLTGFEKELSTTTFQRKMPVDGEVLAVIEKFPQNPVHGYRENPLTLLVYENRETKIIDVLEIESYHVKHQHFGFRPRKNRNISVARGDTIRKDTVFTDTPSKDANGAYQQGVEANVAHMSVNGVIEDGVVISRSFARRIGVCGIEKREFKFGANEYPLNLYGDDNVFKIFPDIGETIRPDGLLAATRSYDEFLDIVNMSRKAVQRVDVEFDNRVYGIAGAEVIDVSVIYEGRDPQGVGTDDNTPKLMSTQARDYLIQERNFYQAIRSIYNEVKKIRGHTLAMSPRFSFWVARAIDYLAPKGKPSIRRMYQHRLLDEWRVEVTFSYMLNPTVPFKITNLHGG